MAIFALDTSALANEESTPAINPFCARATITVADGTGSLTVTADARGQATFGNRNDEHYLTYIIAGTYRLTAGVSGVAQVVFITDEGQAFATALPTGAGTVSWRTTAAVSAYVRAEVRHPGTDPTGTVPGAMAALTNPIFLGRR